MTTQLQGGDEENVLTLLVWHPEHAYEVALRVAPELFSTRAYRRIATVAVAHLQKFGAPIRAHLPDVLEAELRRGEEGRALEAALAAMERLAPDIQPQFVLDRLDTFIALRELFQTAEAIADAVSQGDVEAAELALANRRPPVRETGGIMLSDARAALSFLDAKEETDEFSSGVDALDRRGVRPERGTLTMLIAPSGRGKSWFLVNAGRANAIIHRHNVLHITLELSERKTIGRYIQNLFALSRKRLEDPQITRFVRDDMGRCTGFDLDMLDPTVLNLENRALIADRLKRFRKLNVRVKEFPTRSLTMPRLVSFLDYLERSERYRPDVLIVDYPDLMKTSAENKRVELGNIFADIRGLCGQRGMAGLVVTQSGRSSFSKHTTRGEQVTEDISKYFTADIVLTYSQTDAEAGLGLARLLVEKNRDDEDGFMALVSQHYGTGQFALDSALMNHDLRRELKSRTTSAEGA